MKFLRGEDILPADTQMRNKLFQEKPSACKLRVSSASIPSEDMLAGWHNLAELSKESEMSCKFCSF